VFSHLLEIITTIQLAGKSKETMKDSSDDEIFIPTLVAVLEDQISPSMIL
jgi:hypothetical protein